MDSALPQLTAAEAAAHLQGRAGLAIDRQRQGIELTEGRLALALQELEVAREHEQTELAKRAAGLQQRYQERVAELERQFLLQAEALQQELVQGITKETAKSQKALDAVAEALLTAVEAAGDVPLPLLAPAAVPSPVRKPPALPSAATRHPASPPKLGGKSLTRRNFTISAVAATVPPPAASSAPASKSVPLAAAVAEPRAGKPQLAAARAAAPPGPAGLAQSQGQRTHYGLSLRHESSSEYESDSYYCEEEDSEAFGDGGSAGLATARPPPVKTVQPAGLAALLRQDSLTRARPGAVALARSPTALRSAEQIRTSPATSNPGSPLMRQYSPCMCRSGALFLEDVLSDDD